MKSRFFKDTQGLCEYHCPPDQVCICLRMDKAAYERLVSEAGRQGLSSGEYIQRMMEGAAGAATANPSLSPHRV